MRHPFDLEMSELEKVNFEIEEVSDEALAQVSGGKFTTLKLGEEGGRKPIIHITTQMVGEEGGRPRFPIFK